MVLKFKFNNFSSKRDAFYEFFVRNDVNLLRRRKFEQIELFFKDHMLLDLTLAANIKRSWCSFRFEFGLPDVLEKN